MPITTADIHPHTADPALAVALAVGDDVAAAERLSQLLTDTVLVPISQLAAWAATNGLRAQLQDAADVVGHPLRSIALAALDLLRGSMSDSFDAVAYAPMLDALQSAGMFSPAERDKLTLMATRPRVVTPDDVARAVRNDDGSSKL